MGTIGLILPFAVGVASSPMAIVAVIVLTQSAHAAANTGAFVAGWLLGLVIATVALLLFTGLLGVGAASTPGWLPIVRILGGLMLILFAWERAGAARTASAAATWLGGLDRVSADRALAMGALQAALDAQAGPHRGRRAHGRAGGAGIDRGARVRAHRHGRRGTPHHPARIAGASAKARLETLRDRLAEDNMTIQA